MKKLVIILSFLIITNNIYSQDIFSFDLFNVSLNGALLKAEDLSGNNIYTRNFVNPTAIEFDLDDDGVNELLIADSAVTAGKPFYTLYIYNTIDSFFLADSIQSGSSEPYELPSDETGGIVIVTGNPDYEKFNSDTGYLFLPINCWKYDNGELFLVNDEVYNLFEVHINELTEVIEAVLAGEKKNCETGRKLKSAIASLYSDCINAGDNSIASHFVKNYYFCDDVEKFLQELVLLTKEENISE